MLKNITNGNSYIGQTNNYYRRYIEHRTKTRISNTVLKRAFNKYGKENFVFSILENCPILKLDKREKYYIGFLRPVYNMNDGGVGNRGHFVSALLKKRLSEKSKTWWNGLSLDEKTKIISRLKRPQKGHIVSVGTRQKIRIALKGRPTSDLQKKRSSEVNKVLLKGQCRRFCRVQQLDLVSGMVLRTFNTIKDAAKYVSIHSTGIVSACKGRQKTAGRFKWKYLNDCGVETIPKGSRLEMSASPSAEHP